MEKNRLYIALGVMVLLLAATLLVYRRPQEDTSARPRDAGEHIDRAQITRIDIRRPGELPAVRLEKRDNHWVMTQPAEGPADERAVSDALEALSEMHVASVASRETSSHDDLEVDAAHGIHVELFRGTTAVLNGWVGRNLDSGSALRIEGSPLVYRVDRAIRFPLSKETREWRDRNITNLERDHVRSVEWHNTRGTFHFDRSGETWTLAASSTPIERIDTARVNQTVVNLLQLRALDFAPPTATTGLSDTSPRVTIAVDNGEPVTLRVGGDAPENNVFVQKVGGDAVFTVSRSHGEEINIDPSRLQAPAPAPAGDGGTGDAAAHGDAAAAPAPAPAPPGDGGGLPPGAMEQIRRMLQQRGLQAPPH